MIRHIVRQKGHVFDIVATGKEIELRSHVSEVMDDVNVPVSREPPNRRIHLHLGPVESVAPVDLVLMACDDRDSPGLHRVSLSPEWHHGIERAICFIGCELGAVHFPNDRVIIRKDAH